jgi:outer membrane protein assembly factor BamB
LGLWKIRSPLSSRLADARYDWFTNYGNWANTNANDQGVRLPVKIKWVRRYEGTFKHLPVCGGGRLYLHTAEGQILAVEQETGRLLWRRYFPNTYLSFTSPLYYKERLLVPQAGMEESMLRSFDAATGRLLWEVPFTGSPSWSRQQPPVVCENLAIYMFGSGKYRAQGTAAPFVFDGKPEPSPNGAEIMSWIYTHDNPYYPRDHHPLVRAWNLDTGREVWTRDFSAFGSGGNDAGLCLMDGALYYSTFFGYAARQSGKPSPTGLTAALEPATGKVLWTNTQCSVTAGCTISGKDGRLYLGGYNRPDERTKDRHVRCLDARDGSLVWESDALPAAVNVVSVGNKHLFANASWKDCCLFDRDTGKIVSRFNHGYACTMLTLSEPYLMGSNMDLVDLSAGGQVVYSGPAVDSRECVGSVVSNGRIFYTAQASGLQLSLVYGNEAAASPSPW